MEAAPSDQKSPEVDFVFMLDDNRQEVNFG